MFIFDYKKVTNELLNKREGEGSLCLDNLKMG